MRNFVLLMAVILAGCTQTSREAPTKKVAEITENRNSEEIELAAYKQAYAQGHNKFMEQIGRNTRAWKYTASEAEEITEEKLNELTEKERNAVKDAMDRGYVDGYHSAGESTVCTRFREPAYRRSTTHPSKEQK